jgi:uncharacterized Zn-binding protein involved in type VI secretion
MPPAARVTDMHTCPMVTGVVPHVGGPILPPGEPTVLIGFLPAARVTDKCLCVGPPDIIVKGSPTVWIGKRFAARVLDLTVHGGVIVLGCPTVLIGDTGTGSPLAPVPGVPGSTGTNGPFATQDEAALAALQAANPQSIHENREFSGLIYRGPDGQYYYTGPARGEPAGANPAADAPAPPGVTVVGDYHTHGDYSTKDAAGDPVRTSDPSQDAFNSDNFSTTDRNGIAADGAGTPGYAGYLGTPSGTFRRYDAATGNETVL